MNAVASTGPTEGVYAAADALLTHRANSFTWARRFLSPVHGERATRLYGFCRRVDDLADDNNCALSAGSALSAVRAALESGASANEALSDMLTLMRDCHIDPAIPLDLITGVESDLGEVRLATMAELEQYCYRVAGTVGLMMTAALDVTTPEALPHAVDLGIAMQLTNICRDVREDALQGRRYLPAALVGSLEPAELVAPTGATRATAVGAVHTLLDLADRYYASGEAGLKYLPRGARFGILVAARLYRQIGVVLRRRNADCWSSRAYVGGPGKVGVTLRALGSTVAAGVRRRRAGAGLAD